MTKNKPFYKGKTFVNGKYAFGTIWNMDDVNLEHLKENQEKFDYVWLQKDKGKKTEKDHYHFLAVLSRKAKLSPLQKLFCPKNHKPVHVEQIGNWDGAVKYLQDKFDSGLEKTFEYGERPNKIADGGDSTRTDLVLARQLICDCDTFEDVLNHEDPNVVRAVAAHLPWARSVFDAKEKKTGSAIENYYPWQQEILDLIAQPADKRKIHWYYDPEGGCGKSTFAGVLHDDYNAQILGGSLKDVAYMLKTGKPVAIFDLMRSLEAQFVSYGSMESLKTGYIIGTKYQSCVKYFKPMHVIVFSNHLPLKGKWSKDRYDVYHIHSNGDSVGIPYEELPDEEVPENTRKRKYYTREDVNEVESSVIGPDGEAMSKSYASNPANFKKRKTQEDEEEDG